jgi:GMP synthase (glutamine-hydrolysing)
VHLEIPGGGGKSFLHKKILCIQNIACETLGTLEGLLRSEGYGISNTQANKDPIPKSAKEFSAIIILGGPMSVYDGIKYLNEEQGLIRDAIQRKIPTLGICLGSQLIAGAIGGTVHKGIKKEIGWHRVSLTEKGLNSLFKGLDEAQFKVFQWHGDTYTLPPKTEILAYSDLYPQAFRFGTVYGLQFHLEVTAEMISSWIEEYKKEISDERLSIERILPRDDDEIQDLERKCELVWSNFSRIISRSNEIRDELPGSFRS